MEGQGAFTNVDGHKVTLGPNDFVLTPNGTWHEHGVSEDGTVCIWQDGLYELLLKLGLDLCVPIQTKEVAGKVVRSEEHTSELQSLMRISYAVFCWKKKNEK